MTYDSTEDIEYLKNRMLGVTCTKRNFLGYEESLGSKGNFRKEKMLDLS